MNLRITNASVRSRQAAQYGQKMALLQSPNYEHYLFNQKYLLKPHKSSLLILSCGLNDQIQS